MGLHSLEFGSTPFFCHFVLVDGLDMESQHHFSVGHVGAWFGWIFQILVHASCVSFHSCSSSCFRWFGCTQRFSVIFFFSRNHWKTGSLTSLLMINTSAGNRYLCSLLYTGGFTAVAHLILPVHFTVGDPDNLYNLDNLDHLALAIDTALFW